MKATAQPAAANLSHILSDHRSFPSTKGATLASLATYVRAAQLYVEFCAHRGQTLIGISNEEFIWFKHALLGEPFPDATRTLRRLRGKRGRRTADLMLTLLYSLATDIEERYEVSFDWLRYRGAGSHVQATQEERTHSYGVPSHRTHRIRWIPRKVLGLPDDQFVRLLQTAHQQWGNLIADGDIAWANDPEVQRGALFARNLALLLILRCAGSRRSEVVQLRFEDVDQASSLLYLPTKGHQVEGNRHVPVLLYPWVRDAIWHYVTHFRPVEACLPTNRTVQPLSHSLLFVSHSVRNYGQPLSASSVRAVISTLRRSLDPPWNTTLTPHMLRHAFGYDLQKYGGSAAVVANMRHASSRSSEPYAAGPEQFADEVLLKGNAAIERLLVQAGMLEVLR